MNIIWHIAKKDFLNNILSARFVVGLALCLLIIPFITIINIEYYKNRVIKYESEYSKAQDELANTKVYSGLKPTIVRPPNPLSIFSNGIEENLAITSKVKLGFIPVLPAGSQVDNPFLISFISIDFSGVLAILLSLLGIIFSYDLFTKEREDGTMKLSLGMGLSRTKFFFGKTTGVILTLLPILILCYLLSILIILISNHVQLHLDHWLGLGILFIFSLLYLMVFVLGGAFISSRVQQSSTSIIIGLLIWVWFIFLVPALAANIARSTTQVTKAEIMEYNVNNLRQEYYNIVQNEIIPEVQKRLNKYSRSWWNANGGEDDYFETSGTTYENMVFELEVKKKSGPLIIEYADKIWPISKSWLDECNRQKKLYKSLVSFSPAGLFELLASAICKSDEDAIQSHMEDIREYRVTLIKHFRENRWFESFRYITAQPENEIATDEEARKIRESGNIPKSWSNYNNPPLDLKAVPMFEYKAINISAVLMNSIYSIIVLLLECGILIFLVQWSFNRYDVR